MRWRRSRPSQRSGSMMEAYQRDSPANESDRAGPRYAPAMTSIDLLRLRLRPGEVRREGVEVVLEPFLLGGQRYEAHPETIPLEVDITQASGATVFDMQLHAKLAGPCMRCLGYAEV